MSSRKNGCLRGINREIDRQISLAKRRFLRFQIRNTKDRNDMWFLYKKFKSKTDNYPDWVTPEKIAKFFEDLSWDYESKNVHLPVFTIQDQKIEFTPLKPFPNKDYFSNIISLILDGKYSEFAYGADEISFNNIKFMTTNFWNQLTDLHNLILKNESYPISYRIHKFVPVKKQPLYQNLKIFGL